MRMRCDADGDGGWVCFGPAPTHLELKVMRCIYVCMYEHGIHDSEYVYVHSSGRVSVRVVV